MAGWFLSTRLQSRVTSVYVRSNQCCACWLSQSKPIPWLGVHIPVCLKSAPSVAWQCFFPALSSGLQVVGHTCFTNLLHKGYTGDLPFAEAPRFKQQQLVIVHPLLNQQRKITTSSEKQMEVIQAIATVETYPRVELFGFPALQTSMSCASLTSVDTQEELRWVCLKIRDLKIVGSHRAFV